MLGFIMLANFKQISPVNIHIIHNWPRSRSHSYIHNFDLELIPANAPHTWLLIHRAEHCNTYYWIKSMF